jgi:hypothetical protein
MSLRYNISKQLSFSVDTGYWNLYIKVNSSNRLNSKPFLVEKYVAADKSIADVVVPPNPISYIRCLLRNEPISVPLETDSTAQDVNGWVSFRTSTISRSFYTYESAAKALDSTLAILKSNTEKFESLKPKKMPKLIAINMSSKAKLPSSSIIEAYKGDVIALQLVNGPTCSSVITNSSSGVRGVGVLSVRRVISNSVSVKLLGDDHTYLGLRDPDTLEEYTVNITMLGTSETLVTEEI